MRRALCDQLPKKIGQWVELPEPEVRHLVSVLRLKPEDTIELLDGSGYRANAKIIYRGKLAGAELIEEPETDPRLSALPIHLSMAMIKGDAMEWVIEKATELGVKSLTPIETEFTVVKTHKKGNDVFQERFQKISDQALKQCGRLERMTIHAPISFEEALRAENQLLWLDESLAATAPSTTHLSHFLQTSGGEPFRLLVGPEGGFSASEKGRLLQMSNSLTTGGKQAITRVHLGSLILRAETAALLGISLLVGSHYGKTN